MAKVVSVMEPQKQQKLKLFCEGIYCKCFLLKIQTKFFLHQQNSDYIIYICYYYCIIISCKLKFSSF